MSNEIVLDYREIWLIEGEIPLIMYYEEYIMIMDM